MPKKSFTFSPPARHRDGAAPPDVDREILKKTVDDGVRPLENARMVLLDRIRPDPEQPRRTFDDASLAELAASIAVQGVLQPLWVYYRYEDDDYMIISGERRYRAAQLAGLTEVPVLIGNVGVSRRFLHQLVENLQREDLNAIDKGEALERLKTMMPGTWKEVADMVGLTRRRVEQLRALPHLPQGLQVAVRSGLITEDHARAIARLPERLHPTVISLVERDRLSTRQTRELVRGLNDAISPSHGPPVEVEQAIRDVLARTAAPPSARQPRARVAVPIYEKALEFERVLDRMPILEYQEDRALLSAILGRIAAKIAALQPNEP